LSLHGGWVTISASASMTADERGVIGERNEALSSRACDRPERLIMSHDHEYGSS
jgi:hypothetical protein